MSTDFAAILRGLMQNRGLTRRAVAEASVRAEATINQLMTGSLPPTRDHVRAIAPVLQIDVADLAVIAGMPPSSSDDDAPLGFDEIRLHISNLVSAASYLTGPQIDRLAAIAREMRDDGPGEVSPAGVG